MLKKYHYIIFILSFLCLTLCLIDCTGVGSDSEKVIVRSFYHWKSDFNVDEEQQVFLDDLEVEEIYLHLFDVIWDGEKASPTALTTIDKAPNQVLKPVVYITTDVFVNTDSTEIYELAVQVAGKINTQMEDYSFSEVQFDCDWTPSIKEKYFYFLDEMNSNFKNKTISATVRLYQYKYPELAGIPPVDKGLLMYYNMGDFLDEDELNSILNNEIGKQYLGFNHYPLPIDLALPNFEWNVVWRGRKFISLTHDFSRAELEESKLFEPYGDYEYVIWKDTVINGFYYRVGDLIRPEYCSKGELEEAALLLLGELNQDTTRIIFYDLRDNTKDDYEKLDAVYSIFE